MYVHICMCIYTYIYIHICACLICMGYHYTDIGIQPSINMGTLLDLESYVVDLVPEY